MLGIKPGSSKKAMGGLLTSDPSLQLQFYLLASVCGSGTVPVTQFTKPEVAEARRSFVCCVPLLCPPWKESYLPRTLLLHSSVTRRLSVCLQDCFTNLVSPEGSYPVLTFLVFQSWALMSLCPMSAVGWGVWQWGFLREASSLN